MLGLARDAPVGLGERAPQRLQRPFHLRRPCGCQLVHPPVSAATWWKLGNGTPRLRVGVLVRLCEHMARGCIEAIYWGGLIEWEGLHGASRHKAGPLVRFALGWEGWEAL